MKKVMVFMMLLLSTSLAMAQFGDLEEIIKKAESEKSGEQMPDKPNTPDKPNNYSPSMSLSLFDNAIKDGFYLIKQEYRLEDVNVPGSRYNREGLDYFAGELVMDIGTVLDGEQAVREGLIDELGSLSSAIAALYSMIESGGRD